ncbi:YtoQ family protein [Brevibacterium atlanticum]|uniref:YtoQ family protein n=1 Tax=Brevibacterium atlanticum TaxID=2697563 RepID=UPI001D1822F2
MRSTPSGARRSTAALGTPYVTLDDADIVHPLKAVDAEAEAWCQSTEEQKRSFAASGAARRDATAGDDHP